MEGAVAKQIVIKRKLLGAELRSIHCRNQHSCVNVLGRFRVWTLKTVGVSAVYKMCEHFQITTATTLNWTFRPSAFHWTKTTYKTLNISETVGPIPYKSHSTPFPIRPVVLTPWSWMWCKNSGRSSEPKFLKWNSKLTLDNSRRNCRRGPAVCRSGHWGGDSARIVHGYKPDASVPEGVMSKVSGPIRKEMGGA